MDRLISRTLLQKDSRYQFQMHCMCISRAGISSLIGDWAKYKDKVLDVSDSNQNVETTCNSKLKLTGLKDIYMHIANTIILKL